MPSPDDYILDKPTIGAFPIAQGQAASTIYIVSADWCGVAQAAADLETDIRRARRIGAACAQAIIRARSARAR